MSQPPNTREFSAWINLMPGAPSKIIVVGEVETSASNKQPSLSVSDRNSPGSSTLHLDLSIHSTGGIGTQAFQYWPARYERPAPQGEFTCVVICWDDGEELIRVPVSEVS